MVDERADLAVFGAVVAGLVGMFASVVILLPLAVLNKFAFHVVSGPLPHGFWLPWLAVWSLVPCVVLGYRSGRWWSFVGAAPVLALWPLGTLIASGPHDYFLTLPVTAAVAGALALGSALRAATKWNRSARHRSAIPTG